MVVMSLFISRSARPALHAGAMPLLIVFVVIGVDVATAECFGSGDVLRCVGLGPNSTVPDDVITHLVLDSAMWTPSPTTLQLLWPQLKVHRQFGVL
jgi:hypothetical protein